MSSALIAGISGQDGFYLSQLLISKGYSVFGLIHDTNPEREKKIKAEVPGLELIHGDLTDTASLFKALDISTPSEVSARPTQLRQTAPKPNWCPRPDLNRHDPKIGRF